MTAEQIIKFFRMQPLPQEGGYYVETYRAAGQIKKAALPPGFSDNPSSAAPALVFDKKTQGPLRRVDRNVSTAILYLLTADTVSSLHRLKSDEMFHFYLGNPVTMLQLHPDGHSEIITLGHDILNGQKVQVIVPKGAWQGAFINEGGGFDKLTTGRFALMGCTVAPGFDFADYEQANRKELVKQYPSHRDLITRLTQQ